jgi:TRAP transporter TAXI family solute receptor
MVLNGRAAALWGGGVGWPGFVTVAQAGGRFIAPNSEEAARIRAKHSFLKALTLPANSYAGQREPIDSVGSWSFALAKPALEDGIAYALARALDKGHAAFATRLAQAAETTPQNTAAAAPRPELIHPGVQKYLREIGL